LNLSVRQVNNSLIYANRRRNLKHALSDELKEKAFNLVIEKYQNCNFAYIRDLLQEREGINISVS